MSVRRGSAPAGLRCLRSTWTLVQHREEFALFARGGRLRFPTRGARDGDGPKQAGQNVVFLLQRVHASEGCLPRSAVHCPKQPSHAFSIIASVHNRWGSQHLVLTANKFGEKIVQRRMMTALWAGWNRAGGCGVELIWLQVAEWSFRDILVLHPFTGFWIGVDTPLCEPAFQRTGLSASLMVLRSVGR